MKPERTFYITHASTLQKVAKLLVKAGFERVNYSVFLGWDDPANNPLLKEALQKLLQRAEAKGSVLYILQVSKKDINRIVFWL